MGLRILYAGSPEPACETLKLLFENQNKYGFEIVGVLSNPPSAKGRHKDLIPTPVAAFAQEKSLPVFTPEHLDAAAREEVSQVKADLLVCFAYGHIFGPKFMALFKLGGINLHPSLLPKYRGCSPVPAAILNQDNQTAVTIQTLSPKMDEGDILAQTIIDLNKSETSESLLHDSAVIGAELICGILKTTSEKNILPQGKKQEGQASYTGMISKNDAKINWSESAASIEAKIRAYFPDPGCWTSFNNEPLKLLKAEVIPDTQNYQDKENGQVLDYIKNQGIIIKTGKDLLCVKKLQRQGKNPMEYKDFMNGARNFVGTILQ